MVNWLDSKKENNQLNHLQVVPPHYHGDGSRLICFCGHGSTFVNKKVELRIAKVIQKWKKIAATKAV